MGEPYRTDQKAFLFILLVKYKVYTIFAQNLRILICFEATLENNLFLDYLPVDVLLCVFKYLDIRSLGRVAQVF